MTTIIKNGSKNYQIDTVSNRITMLDARFYQTPSGIFVPSVTTILSAYPKSAGFYEWLKKVGEDADEIRDEAGRKGSAVHELTERYDAGEEVCLLNENGFIEYKLIEWAMFERYVDFKKRFQPTVIYSELNLVSETLGCAGTLDRVIQFKDKLVIIDIKTSNALHEHYWLQLAAYKELLSEVQPELKIDGYAILWLNAKTKTEGKTGTCQGVGWQMVGRSEDELQKDWNLFQATQKLWLAENETLKPRQTTYQLKHVI